MRQHQGVQEADDEQGTGRAGLAGARRSVHRPDDATGESEADELNDRESDHLQNEGQHPRESAT